MFWIWSFWFTKNEMLLLTSLFWLLESREYVFEFAWVLSKKTIKFLAFDFLSGFIKNLEVYEESWRDKFSS